MVVLSCGCDGRQLAAACASGYAQTVFGAATYVGLIYPALAVPTAGLGVLVGLSRVYPGVHFPLDVVTGGLPGRVH